MMTATDAIDLYHRLGEQGIDIWIDGGWGVDALLGEQTRPHDDVDIVIEEQDLPALRALLEGDGYHDVPRGDTRPWNFVLGDDHGHLVDVHAIAIDGDGNGIYGPPENGELYPAAALLGRGTIAGQPVRCIAAQNLVQFHIGYKPRPHDYADVRALCARFGIPLPEQFT